jgi:hypothetical protein
MGRLAFLLVLSLFVSRAEAAGTSCWDWGMAQRQSTSQIVQWCGVDSRETELVCLHYCIKVRRGDPSTCEPLCATSHSSHGNGEGHERPACTFDVDCPFGKVCNEGMCLSPGVPPDHGECSFDSDCAMGRRCVNGACVH